MRNYITIIFLLLDFFILINVKKLKPIENFKIFINILAIIQLSFVLWIFYIDNELIILNFMDSLGNKAMNMFLHAHQMVPSRLKP